MNDCVVQFTPEKVEIFIDTTAQVALALALFLVLVAVGAFIFVGLFNFFLKYKL